MGSPSTAPLSFLSRGAGPPHGASASHARAILQALRAGLGRPLLWAAFLLFSGAAVSGRERAEGSVSTNARKPLRVGRAGGLSCLRQPPNSLRYQTRGIKMLLLGVEVNSAGRFSFNFRPTRLMVNAQPMAVTERACFLV